MHTIRALFAERILEASMSYQAGPSTDTLEWNLRLLDEAAEHGVTILSHLIGQDGLCEPYEHWGLDYPSEIYKEWRNPSCRNAQPETEYLPAVIEHAHLNGIKYYAKLISMEHSWLYADHPDWLERNRYGVMLHKLCPDVPAVRETILQYLVEFVQRYAAPDLLDPLDGVYLDHHRYRSYEECWCEHTQRGFRERYGIELWEATPSQRREYRSQVVADFTAEVTQALRAISPGLCIGLTEVDESWGHIPAIIRPEATGLDFVHVQYLSRPDRKLYDQFKAKVERYAAFFPEVWLQFDCRTPVPWTVASMGRFWTSIPSMYTMMEFAAEVKRDTAHADHLKGISFFNLTAVPEDHPHRRTVFNCFNYELPEPFEIGPVAHPEPPLDVNIT